MIRLVISLLLLITALCGYAQPGNVIVNIQGIQTAKGGEVSAGIFRKENFLKSGKQDFAAVVAVSAAEMKIVFDNIPAGTYAIVVFQDIDKNKKLKTNLIGFPTEPFGFSRNARIKFGPPGFDEVKVDVPAGKTVTVSISLR
jgi:uncharacterized protein (DUF2141 family)